MKNNNQNQDVEILRKDFFSQLESAVKFVESWPAWKREALSESNNNDCTHKSE